MNIKRLLLSSIVIWLVGGLYSCLTCGWFFNWVYKIPPIIWKDPAEMMSAGNMTASSILGFLTAFIFVAVFAVLYKGIPKKGVQKGLMYGFLVWLIGPLIGTITMPFYMTIASQVVVYWIVNSFVSYMILGALVGWIYKTK